MANTFRVALVGPPVSGAGRRERDLPSLALAQLAAVAHEQGHELLLRDAAASGAAFEQTVKEIVAFQPDLLVLSATTPAVKSAGAVATAVRQALSDCFCVLGGSHTSAVPRSTLEAIPALDAALVGEGEETLLELLSRLPGRDFSGVRGLVWRDGEEIRSEERRPRIGDLNLLPLPWWEGYPGYPEAYRAAAGGRRWPASYLVTSRGCPYRCTFCDRSVFGYTVTTFSAEYILRAVDDMVRRFGVREIDFEDDLFTVYEPRLRRICEGLIERRHDLIWNCHVRAETVGKEMFRLMRQAGCRQVTLGVESGDERVLALARKRLRPAQIAHAVKAARRAKLPVKGSFILGLPSEDDAAIEKSIRLALELPFDDVEVAFLAPLPGSEISDRAEEWGRMVAGADLLDTARPVYLPHGMTAERLVARRNEFCRRFYLRPRYFGKLIGRLITHPRSTLRLLGV